MSADLMFWAAAGLLTAIAVAVLLRPLLGGAARPDAAARDADAAPAGRAAYDIAVYRDQLAEIERDAARGVLDAEAAAAARLEIERRILAADASAARSSAPAPAAASRAPRWIAAAIAVGLPLAALGLYAELGAPGLGESAAPRQAAPLPPADPELQALVDQLARRMAEDPTDPRGWLLLARSYAALGRYDDSVAAYRSAIEHGAAEGSAGAEVHSAYGEALTAAADGQVTAAARAAFEAALALDPGEPRARFYLALADAQAGQPEAALAAWIRLEADAAPDAPWRDAVSAEIERTAALLGLDPANLPGRAPAAQPGESAAEAGAAGPDEADMAAAAAMTPAEREAFIRSMVDGLAARLETAPDDLAGWLRLARAYGVLGEAEKAERAWARAAALAPQRADIQLGLAQAIHDAHAGAARLPDSFAAAVARARALDPENPLGLFLGGLAAADAGQPQQARALWQRLRDRLPAGSPERREIEARLAALPGG